MADRCYYDVLNIEKSATDDEIKRAYRKLAVRYHPDKNLDNKEAAEVKFKEIGEAYSVLSDENKRRQYDRFGKSAVNGSAGGNGHSHGMSGGFHGQDADEIFRSFFGGQDPFSMFFQEGLHGGGGFGGTGQRVHVTQFGPGFSFSTFGNAPGGMRGGNANPFQQRPRQHQQQQQQQGTPDANSRLRIGGGNLLLVLFLLWIMGVPISYLWIALMLASYLGVV